MAGLTAEEVRSMTVIRLRAALSSRGLDATGKKTELVARLLASIDDPEADNPDHEREPLAPATAGTSSSAEEDLRTTIVSVVAEALPTLLAAINSTTSNPPGPSSVQVNPEPSATGPSLSIASSASVQPASKLISGAVPKKVSDRILAGEFVEFSDLLPLVASSAHATTHSNTVKFELSEGGPLRVVEDGVPRGKTRHVCDLATWMEAYTIYVHTLIQVAPHRALELLAYQALIVEANRRFVPEGWLDYDRQFRLAASADPSKKWDTLDVNIWQITTTGKSRPTCTTCNMSHPPSPNGACLFRPSRSSPVSTASSWSPTAYHQGRPICRNFNQGKCYGNCSRVHVCHTCRGRHPAIQCNGSSSGPKSAASSKKPKASQ